MMHTSSESDITSLGPPSSASPRAYYVQSPSGDSQDDTDKCSSSINSNSSPSDPRHSLTSSSTSTAISRIFGNRRRWNKHYCDVVVEESDDDYYGDRAYVQHRNSMLVALTFLLFLVAVFVGVWCVGSRYKAQVSIKSLWIENVYYGQGSDHTGVPTKLMTLNCSANLTIHNPSKYFGIQVFSHRANLIFSHITVASGQLKKYYQPRKSTRVMRVKLVGKEVPLYGAGVALSSRVPVKLEFEVESIGNLMGELMKTKHSVHFSCFFLILTHHTSQQIIFHNTTCIYL